MAMQPLVRPGSAGEQVGRLLVAVMIILMLPSLPFGSYLVYPFMILTTWFHEMGHGITALLMWQEFEQLQIFPNDQVSRKAGWTPTSLPLPAPPSQQAARWRRVSWARG